MNNPGGTAAAATMAPITRPRTQSHGRRRRHSNGAAATIATTTAPAPSEGDGQSEPVATPIWATMSATSTPIATAASTTPGRAAQRRTVAVPLMA